MMKFETPQKEYEIEDAGTVSRNGETVPAFTLKVSKPFQIDATFSLNDIKTRQNTEGVLFSEYSDIAKKLNSKKEVLFSLTPEALQYVRENGESRLAALREEAGKQIVQKWFWAVGGDSGALYVTPDIDTEFRPDIKAIEETVEKTRGRGNILQMLREKSTLSDRQTALYTDGWFEISNEDMMQIYETIIAKEDEAGKIEKAKHEKREEEKKAIFEKAKTTGERQVLYKTFDECDDPREECSLDEIVTYAMPDGTTKTERYHTY
jgi:hypothetical protein